MTIIQRVLSKIIESEFYRNIISLFTGIFVARFIPFVFALAVARLYAPSDFGNFVLFLTIGSVLSILSTGKYENAILLVNSSTEKKLIGSFAQKVNSGINLIALLIIVVIILIGSPTKEQIVYLLLVPFYSYFFSAIQLIRNIYISHKKFYHLSALEISRAVATGVLQCSLFILPTGLFIGAVLAQAIIYFFYSIKVRESSLFRFGRFTTEERMLALRYIKFPRFSVASEMMNFMSSQLPVFIFKPFFGAQMLGLYSFSHRYISVPVQLLSVSISSVYIQHAKTLEEAPGKLSELTFSLFKKQVVFGIIPFLILGFWGEQIFSVVFGNEWAFSGYLAQFIAPWLFAVMIGSPLSAIILIKEKQDVSLWYNVSLLLARTSGLLVGGFIFKDTVITVALYSLVGVVFFTFLCVYSLRLAGVDLKKAGFYFLKMMLLILPFIVLKIWL